MDENKDLMEAKEENVVNFVPPAPESDVPDGDNELTNFFDTDVEVNSDNILSLITSTDEEGHSPSYISITLERVNNIVPGKPLNEYEDDDRELVDNMDIADCAVDIYTLDGETYNLTLTFDTIHSSYLADLMSALDRYRSMVEDFAGSGVTDTAAAFSILFMPVDMKGKGSCLMSLPVMYTRCLADNGMNVAVYMQFKSADVQFYSIDMTEEEEVELTAETLRMAEQGTGGDIFES